MRAGVSARTGGVSAGGYESLNMGFLSGDDRESVLENRRRAMRAFLAAGRDGETGGSPPGGVDSGVREEAHGRLSNDILSRWVGVKQVHAANVLVADETHAGSGALSPIIGGPGGPAVEADAICTATRGLVLTIQVADCVPVAVYDAGNNALGVAHCGWRGTAGHVLIRLLEHMGGEFGTIAKNVYAGIGPGICGGCLEVGGDVARHFVGPEYEGYRVLWDAPKNTDDAENNIGVPPVDDESDIAHADPKYRVNIWAALHAQLTNSGVPHPHIETMVTCSMESPDILFSHRRDGAKCGRNALFAMIV